jgi:hypothetical protein
VYGSVENLAYAGLSSYAVYLNTVSAAPLICKSATESKVIGIIDPKTLSPLPVQPAPLHGSQGTARHFSYGPCPRVVDATQVSAPYRAACGTVPDGEVCGTLRTY